MDPMPSGPAGCSGTGGDRPQLVDVRTFVSESLVACDVEILVPFHFQLVVDEWEKETWDGLGAASYQARMQVPSGFLAVICTLAACFLRITNH